MIGCAGGEEDRFGSCVALNGGSPYMYAAVIPVVTTYTRYGGVERVCTSTVESGNGGIMDAWPVVCVFGWACMQMCRHGKGPYLSTYYDSRLGIRHRACRDGTMGSAQRRESSDTSSTTMLHTRTDRSTVLS